MNQDNKEFDISKYKDELASLKRVSIQIKELQKWLLNTSMASLAFAFTFMLQVKDSSIIPHSFLAVFTLVCLILAIALGLLIRARNEWENFAGDVRGFFPLSSVLQKLLIESNDLSNEEKEKYSQYFEKMDNLNKKNNTVSGSPFTELYLICVNFISLLLGIGGMCLYVCYYLFSI